MGTSSDQNRLESERRVVSVVFADLSGFTEMSERLDPEQVTDIVNYCFERLGAVVDRFEGYIDKFMGDCMMVLFGAPIAHENDTELAVECALEMLRELKEINQAKELSLQMSIGINVGTVIAGEVGSTHKREYTVMGDAVNLSQRLEAAAEAGQILVSEGIKRACSARFKFQHLDPIFVKGKQEAVAVYSVLGQRESTQVADGFGMKMSSLVGREKELATIRDLIGGLSQKGGSLLGVSGEAGVGKSRLKWEIKKISSEMEVQWVEAKCSKLHRQTPYALIAEILHGLKSSLGDDWLSRTKLDATSKNLLLELMGNTQVSLIEGKKKRVLVFVAVKRLLLEVSRNHPVLLHLEDLHWVDPLSYEFLDQLIHHLPESKLLLYASFRPEFHHRWKELEFFCGLSLSKLDSYQSLQMARYLLSQEILPSELENVITEKCDGNPFYIEEILKNLIDLGELAKDQQDQWFLRSSFSQNQLPPTIHGLLASRLDRLGKEEKRVIQLASVIGRSFERRILEESFEDPRQIDGAIKKLQEGELVFEADSELVFKHALTQEVAYQGILKKRRRELHQVVAQTIKRLYGDNHTQHLEALAHHWVQAGDVDNSVYYLHRFGKRMARDYNNEGALRAYKEAMDLLERNDSRYEPICFDAARVCRLIGDFQRASDFYRDVLEQTKDKRSSAEAYKGIGEILRIQGKSTEAVDSFETALELLDGTEHFKERIESYKGLGLAWKGCSDDQKALKYLEKGLAMAKKHQLQKLEAEYENDIATILIDQKLQLDEAEKKLNRVVELANGAVELKSLMVSAILNLGVVDYFRNDLQLALEKFEKAAVIAKEIGDLRNVLILKHNIGELFVEFQQYDRAQDAFEEGYELAKSMGHETERLNNLNLRGYVCSQQGKSEEGLELLEKASHEAYQGQSWKQFCEAQYYISRILESQGKIEDCMVALQKGRDIALRYGQGGLLSRFDESMERLKDGSAMNGQNNEGASSSS